MTDEIRKIITDQINRHVAMQQDHRAWLADDITTRVLAEIAATEKRTTRAVDGCLITSGGDCNGPTLCNKIEALRAAIKQARDWGITSKGYSAGVAIAIADWVDAGMRGDPPPLPDYFPKS